jgi:hypothetical protein
MERSLCSQPCVWPPRGLPGRRTPFLHEQRMPLREAPGGTGERPAGNPKRALLRLARGPAARPVLADP